MGKKSKNKKVEAKDKVEDTVSDVKATIQDEVSDFVEDVVEEVSDIKDAILSRMDKIKAKLIRRAIALGLVDEETAENEIDNIVVGQVANKGVKVDTPSTFYQEVSTEFKAKLKAKLKAKDETEDK